MTNAVIANRIVVTETAVQGRVAITWSRFRDVSWTLTQTNLFSLFSFSHYASNSSQNYKTRAVNCTFQIHDIECQGCDYSNNFSGPLFLRVFIIFKILNTDWTWPSYLVGLVTASKCHEVNLPIKQHCSTPLICTVSSHFYFNLIRYRIPLIFISIAQFLTDP